MKIDDKYLPKIYNKAFHCPRCNVLAPQRWFVIEKEELERSNVTIREFESDNFPRRKISPSFGNTTSLRFNWDLQLSFCTHCEEYTVWENKSIIYPFQLELPQPHDDMFDNVKGIYIEAMHVYKHSPRAAAALLRLAIETMIPQLDEYKIKKSSINNMIAELVKKEIPSYVQQGLDSIRVYGNEGIHTGEIVLNEEPETVLFLFELLNIMVDELITKKRKIKNFYDKLPTSKLTGIFNRDKAKQ